MTTNKNVILLYFLIFTEFIILINSNIVIKSVISSSSMFILKIFPSLFPTMVIGLCLIKNNISFIIPRFIKYAFNKLFNFDEHMTTIYIMSMICGTPSNAIFINDYVNKGLINEKSASNLLCCSHFINPLFVIGGVGLGVFNNAKIGVILLLLLYLSNFIKAFILRNSFQSVSKKATQ